MDSTFYRLEKWVVNTGIAIFLALGFFLGCLFLQTCRNLKIATQVEEVRVIQLPENIRLEPIMVDGTMDEEPTPAPDPLPPIIGYAAR